ncbi:hypothetical protein lerEdw1_005136 [Lerista edwardsae]|nr:hypothetical protein lerEdw1_005136 [Lerista edwardsae]
MPKCPRCQKEVYFVTLAVGESGGKQLLQELAVSDFVLSLQHDGKPYCNHPCYAALFGPKGLVELGLDPDSFASSIASVHFPLIASEYT